MASTLRNAIDLFVSIGLYDVILPFLLVFTLMYAFLDKTRVLGTENYWRKGSSDPVQIPRKNLNAMIAFVTGLFVVLSAQLVGIINQVLAQTVLLIMLSFLVMLVVGSFMKQTTDGVYFDKDNPVLFYGLITVSVTAIIFIFLNAIRTADGRSWLSIIFDGVRNSLTGSSSEMWSVIILLILIIGGIAFIVGNGNNGPKDD